MSYAILVDSIEHIVIAPLDMQLDLRLSHYVVQILSALPKPLVLLGVPGNCLEIAAVLLSDLTQAFSGYAAHIITLDQCPIVTLPTIFFIR